MANKKAEAPLQEQRHLILKPIRYKNPDSPLYRQRITPDDGLLLTFPHLSTAEIMLLRKKRVIAAATEQDIADLKAAAAAREKEEREAIAEAEKRYQEAKIAALNKQLNRERGK